MIRSRISSARPVISARAMTSAMTPTSTPRIEMIDVLAMDACLRRAVR